MAKTNKISNSRRFKILGILVLGLIMYIVIDTLTFTGARSFYYLSDDKCVTVWKSLNDGVYIIFEKYKSSEIPTDNYIKTTYDNALIIVVDDLSDYDYIISNNYGKNIEIYLSGQKSKYYDYNEREGFINDYYLNGQIKSHLKYLQIDIKENHVVINGKKCS